MRPMWLRSLALSVSNDADTAWRLVSLAMRAEAFVSGLALLCLAFIASLDEDHP